jgi:hypothetical protein
MAVPTRAPDPTTGIAQNAQEPHDSSYIDAEAQARIALSEIFAKFPTLNIRAIGHMMATDPAQFTSAGTVMSQQKHSNVEDDQLVSGNHDEAESPPKSNLDDHYEACLQGESSQLAITVASCPATDILTAGDRQRADSPSLTVAGMDSVPKQDHTPNSTEHPTSVPDCDASCDTNCPQSCLQGASAETAGTTAEPFSCPATNPQIVDNPGSLTSPETDPVQKKDDTPAKGGPAAGIERDAARPEPSSPIPSAAGPSTQRPKSARSSNTSSGHRVLHSAKIARKGSNRVPRSRAQQHHRPSANTTRSPAKVPAAEVPADDAPDGLDDDGTPEPPRLSAKAKGKRKATDDNQVPQPFQIPQPPQANVAARAAARRDRYPMIDMEGVPHVVGGLVEASLGRKDPLFARQGKGNLSDPYNGVKVERHNFFPFPPPDMRESNIEFDRELEERRPIFDGFDLDLIDHQVDAYAEQTKFLDERMKEHRDEFDPVIDEFLANKAELTRLNYERQRAITSEYAIKQVMTPRERRERLAQVAMDEAPLFARQRILEPQLKELILRSRSRIARGLRQDLRVPNVIDNKRERARQRETIEEEKTALGIAGAMIGLQGTLKEQNHTTHTAILRFTKHVVDTSLKEFDDEEKWHKPDNSGPTNPPSNLDTVAPTVPEWFTILDARGFNPLYAGATPKERFKNLLEVTGALLHSAKEDQYADESRPERYTWNKEYHEPNDGWPKAVQRAIGGWWACRSGPDASPAERNCRLCHQRGVKEAVSASTPSMADLYQRILNEIESAMAEANKRDRSRLKHQLQQEREAIDRYWQQREWSRSGGGVDISEVMHSRDVNDLNYRPSAGRSESRQGPNSAAQSQDPFGKQAGGKSRSDAGLSHTPHHRAGSS